MRKLRSSLQNLYCWQYSEGLQYCLLAFETINIDKQEIFFLSVCASKQYWFRHSLSPQNTGSGSFAVFLKFKNGMSRSTIRCNIDFRARQRGEGKALLPRMSKGLRAAGTRFSKQPRDMFTSAGPNCGFNIQETAQTAALGLRRWKSLWGE